MLKNVLNPWLVVIAIQLFGVIGISLYLKDSHYLTVFIHNGGIGPGSYYIYIYLQLWLLIPLLYKLLNSKPLLGILSIFAICVIVNVVCVKIQVSDNIYRLLCFRYLFLSVIAYIWLKYDINWYIVILLSLISVAYWYLCDCSFGILTYSGGWSSQNWPAFFYSLLFVKILEQLYRKVETKKTTSWIVWLGKNSWYIFLAQLFFLGFVGFELFSTICNHLNIDNYYFIRILYVLFAIGISIIPVWFIQEKFKNGKQKSILPN